MATRALTSSDLSTALGRVLAGVVMSVWFAATGCAPQAQVRGPAQPVVRQVDHVLLASPTANDLFALLSETFALPVVWPMTDYSGFASGGVALGNVNIEVLKDGEAASGDRKARWTGFALEPEPLKSSLPELKSRGMPFGSPSPFRGKRPDGSVGLLWTTVGLASVSADSRQVFFCEYAFDIAGRRREFAEQLDRRRGGPLSVISIREIVIGARDITRAEERWQALLNPLEPTPGRVWRLGDGPAIRLVAAATDEVQGIVINVRSLSAARRFLEGNGMLGAESSGSLTLTGRLVQGLNVTLVEPDIEPSAAK